MLNHIFTGRTKLTLGITKDQINAGNIVSLVKEAYLLHGKNASECDYLWNYYKGDQPILYRDKSIRPEINNKVLINRANEIVAFKLAYICGEPIQYISRQRGNSNEKSNEVSRKADEVSRLNEMVYSESKQSEDRDLFEWQMVCGTSYRLVLPDKAEDKDEAPFEIYTLDPRATFVVYSNSYHKSPLFAATVSEYTDENGRQVPQFTVYTDKMFYKIIDNDLISSEPHVLGAIPIIEYPANQARLGAFEPVLTLLDAINLVESDRVNGVEQFVQAYMKFINCDVEEETLNALKELGAIKIKSTNPQMPADVELVTAELKQTETQTLVDNLYQTVLTICGIPNRHGGASTSDTGAAVMLRDGWSATEARAKDTELMFKRPEQEFLKIVLRICAQVKDFTISVHDIDLKFTRRNYENIQSKSQVLVTMLQNDKIHPLLAFTHCGMFSDPENAFKISEEYVKQRKEEMLNDPMKGKRQFYNIPGIADTKAPAKEFEPQTGKENLQTKKSAKDK